MTADKRDTALKGLAEEFYRLSHTIAPNQDDCEFNE
jgi:hypothetical protein